MKTAGGGKGIVVQPVVGSKAFPPVCNPGRIAAAVQKLMWNPSKQTNIPAVGEDDSP